MWLESIGHTSKVSVPKALDVASTADPELGGTTVIVEPEAKERFVNPAELPPSLKSWEPAVIFPELSRLNVPTDPRRKLPVESVPLREKV
jgi:hypothetical protein